MDSSVKESRELGAGKGGQAPKRINSPCMSLTVTQSASQGLLTCKGGAGITEGLQGKRCYAKT